MTMTRRGHRVAAIQIKISLAAARINPDTFATLRDHRHLLVRRELILLFARDNFIEIRFDCCCHRILTTEGTEDHSRGFVFLPIPPPCPLWLISLTDSNLSASTPSSHPGQTSNSCSARPGPRRL